MQFFVGTSGKDEVIDITEEINRILKDEEFEEGICSVFVRHTTCAITTADLDPGTDKDFLNFLRTISPKLDYKHPHDPMHAPDHIISSIIGAGLSIPVLDGQLSLGTWQKVVLVELNGPRKRSLDLTFVSN